MEEDGGDGTRCQFRSNGSGLTWQGGVGENMTTCRAPASQILFAQLKVLYDGDIAVTLPWNEGCAVEGYYKTALLMKDYCLDIIVIVIACN